MFEPTEIQEMFAGLRELEEATFPKRCRTCGREYASVAEFVSATHAVRPDCTGLKQGRDEDNQPVVDLFRNCACGSTLMESFNDRRDLSEAGLKRRRRFEGVLDHLLARGVARETAYAELLKLLRGQPNDLLPLIRSVTGDRPGAGTDEAGEAGPAVRDAMSVKTA